MCHPDSGCEMGHCKVCGCHTIGNQFIAGQCQLCWELEEQREREAWCAKLAEQEAKGGA